MTEVNRTRSTNPAERLANRQSTRQEFPPFRFQASSDIHRLRRTYPQLSAVNHLNRKWLTNVPGLLS